MNATPTRPGRARVALRLAALALAAGPAAGVQLPDPFAAGARWEHASGPDDAWIPRSIAFAGGGELVWTAPVVGDARLSVYPSAALGGAAPSYVDPSIHGSAGVFGAIPVVGGPAGDDLYAVRQEPAPSVLERRTTVSRHDLAQASAGGGFGAHWEYVYDDLVAGPARLAADRAGSALVLAVYDKGSGRVVLDWIDRQTGLRTHRVERPAVGLTTLTVSSGGLRAAFVSGLDLWVVSRAGATLHHETLPSTTEALALSEDGATVVVGDFARARVLSEGPQGFGEVLSHPAPADHIATRAAVSADGGTAAVGFWDYASGSGVRLDVFDTSSGAVEKRIVQSGGPGGLQNFPEAVAISADGTRAAFGLWGDGGTAPDVLLLDVGEIEPRIAEDLGGASVYALALDESATRVAVATKAVHANEFGTAGGVRLFDTGERTTQVRGRVQPGGALALDARRPGAHAAAFVVGLPGVPLALPGFGGALEVDLAGPLFVLGAAADADGRASVSLGMPPNPALALFGIAAQVLWLEPTGAGFDASVVHPMVH